MKPFWKITYCPEGREPLPVRLYLNDLSSQRTREMKARFGPSYGIPAEFISLLLRGDMDAVACAIWIGQQKAGGKVEDPREMDFSLDDLEPLNDPEDEVEEERPTEEPTSGSRKTSKRSAPSGSSTSPTSAD